jgi:hypothetical protein
MLAKVDHARRSDGSLAAIAFARAAFRGGAKVRLSAEGRALSIVLKT